MTRKMAYLVSLEDRDRVKAGGMQRINGQQQSRRNPLEGST